MNYAFAVAALFSTVVAFAQEAAQPAVDMTGNLAVIIEKWPIIGMILAVFFGAMLVFRAASEALLLYAEAAKNDKIGVWGKKLEKLAAMLAVVFAKIGYGYPKKLTEKPAAPSEPGK